MYTLNGNKVDLLVSQCSHIRTQVLPPLINIVSLNDSFDLNRQSTIQDFESMQREVCEFFAKSKQEYSLVVVEMFSCFAVPIVVQHCKNVALFSSTSASAVLDVLNHISDKECTTSYYPKNRVLIKLVLKTFIEHATLVDYMLINSSPVIESSAFEELGNELACEVIGVGPTVLLKALPNTSHSAVNWITQQTRDIVYISFGTMAKARLNQAEIEIIKESLNQLDVGYVWSLPGFSEQSERGIIAEYVPQLEILLHEKVKIFISHCGWNSCIESLCGNVNVLGFPRYFSIDCQVCRSGFEFWYSW